jgi:hypothetical protein
MLARILREAGWMVTQRNATADHGAKIWPNIDRLESSLISGFEIDAASSSVYDSAIIFLNS